MKIGIIGTRGIPNHYGGFEQLAQWLSTGLVAKGHEVFVYNPHWHPYKEEQWNSVQIIHCKDPVQYWGTKSQFIYDLHCINDSCKRNFDVLLHLGYTSDSVWHKRWPRKTIHIVNMDGLEWKRSKYGPFTRRFLRRAESLASYHAALLIADSPGIQEYLESKYKRSAVYIPYGAEIFRDPDPAVIKQFHVAPFQYGLAVARLEPENNIEMIIEGTLEAKSGLPLVVIGDYRNKYGTKLLRKYKSHGIRFIGPVYETRILNNLRFHAAIYFHGHSAGGTNPSLLEAMACGCRIAAHDNIFNRAVLQDAEYFFTAENIYKLIQDPPDRTLIEERKKINTERICKTYHWQKIIDAYEAAMIGAIRSST